MIEMPISKGYVALLSDEDAHLTRWKWSARERSNGRVYAQRTVWLKGQSKVGVVHLHREVLGLSKGDGIVDHKDGNGINCQRENLRKTNLSVNSRNAPGPRDKISISGFRGVSWKSDVSQWRVSIAKEKNLNVHLGCYDDLEEAKECRVLHELLYWGVEPRRAVEMGAI